MDIFVLHEEPSECVKLYSDVHVTKMLIESCQLLSTVHKLTGTSESVIPYNATQTSHPCIKWLLRSRNNYIWLAVLAANLDIEYTYRTGKNHKSSNATEWLLAHVPDSLMDVPQTPFIIGFNTSKFYVEVGMAASVIDVYRAFYKKYKQGYSRKDGTHITYKWSKRGKPEFMCN